MRQVFSSRRLENVEGVAKLLEDAGIETRTYNGRSYKGNHRHAFSYREGQDQTPQAELWVVKSEDLPKAREILREAGLLETTRPAYVPAAFAGTSAPETPKTPEQRALKLKIALLFACVIAIALMLIFR